MITQTERFDVTEAASRFLRRWGSGSFDTLRGQLAFAGFLLFLCAAPILAGPIVQCEYAHDAFIFLDGAWRVLHGQRPQIDFSTNLGPVVFLLTAAGIAITKHGGYALVIAQSLMGVIVATFAYYLSVRRLPRYTAVILSTAIVLLALAPYNTGEFPFLLTFGMMYNRMGYALLGVLLIESTKGPERSGNQNREEWVGGALTGLICAILLFLKITYFMVAVALIVALLPYRTQHRQRFVGMAVGWVAFTLAMLVYLRFDIAPIFREMRISAGAKHIPRLDALGIAMGSVELTIFLLMLGFLFVWLLRGARRGVLLSRPAAIFFTIVIGYSLIITNHQGGGQPLSAFLCFLIATELAIALWPTWDGLASLSAPAALVAIGLSAPLIAFTIPTAVAYILPVLGPHVRWQRYVPEERLSAPAVADFRSKDDTPRFDRADNVEKGNYVDFVNEGLALVRAHSSHDESVVSLEFSNPFSFSLQRVPPQGGTTCIQYGVTFDLTHKLAPDELFGDAKIAMVPTVYSSPLLADAVERIYMKPLRARFDKVAESEHWTLFRRKIPQPRS